MDETDYTKIYGYLPSGFHDKRFHELREYLKGVPNVSNRNEIQTIKATMNRDEIFPQYIEALREIAEKYERDGTDIMTQHIGEPPILCGTIDGWIGYGSEPEMETDEKKVSYNQKKADIIGKAISSVANQYSIPINATNAQSVRNSPIFIQAVRQEIQNRENVYEIDSDKFCFDISIKERMRQYKVNMHSEGIKNTMKK